MVIISVYINSFTYTQTAGAANSKLSNLSKKPPWPGIMVPLSFTLAMRLSLLSNKSPIVPKMAQRAAMIAASFTVNK